MQVITLYKRTFLLVIGLMMVIILSSCAGADTPTSTQNVPNLASNNSTTTTTSTSNTISAGNVVVKTLNATVDNKSEIILVDTNGKTL
jgi:hypothetical protein